MCIWSHIISELEKLRHVTTTVYESDFSPVSIGCLGDIEKQWAFDDPGLKEGGLEIHLV